MVDGFKPFLEDTKTIIARARLFVDLQGYYLSKHNDSWDTFLAYICPFESFATTTSLFSSSSNSGAYRSTSDLSKLEFGYKSQFSPNSKISLLTKDNWRQVAEYNDKSLELYSLNPIHLKPDEAIVIPNAMFVGLNRHRNYSSFVHEHFKRSGHGVFPR